MQKIIKLKKCVLTEAIKIKSLDTMSEDEFDSLIDSVLNKVDQVKKVDYSSDLEARVQEIQADAEDVMKNRELAAEDERNLGDERRAIRAQEREKAKYNPTNFKNMEAFKFNFYHAIKDQVEEYEDEEETWSVLNRRHEDDPSIVLPGHRIDDQGDDIPSIDIYFDQSGSWTEDDIEVGRAAISCINEFDRQGEIRLNIYYFSDSVHTNAQDARDEGGTSAWSDILANIQANKTKNVVIVTDSDMGGYARRAAKKLVIDGCVWFIWKRGVNSQELPKHLLGRKGNFQYAFS